MASKIDPKVTAAEKAVKKALDASMAAKEAVSEAAKGKKHPRQLNKARAAVQNSVEDLGRGARWIERWNKVSKDLK